METELLDRVQVNPKIFGGKPIIRGMRIAVENVLGMLAAGDTPERILQEYPLLQPEDIQACLVFAYRSLAGEQIHERVAPCPPFRLIASKESQEAQTIMTCLPRIALCLFLALCFSATPLLAQKGLEEEVKQAEKNWIASVKNKDQAALGAILAKELVYTHSTGLVEDKSQYLQALTSGNQRYDSIVYEDPAIQTYWVNRCACDQGRDDRFNQRPAVQQHITPYACLGEKRRDVESSGAPDHTTALRFPSAANQRSVGQEPA